MAAKFTKNTLITIATRTLSLIISTMASIIIARILGPEGKGIYALAFVLPSLLFMFAEFGVSGATVYYVAKGKYSPKDIFAVNVALSIAVGVLSSILALIIIFFFRDKVVPGVALEYLLLAVPFIPLYIFQSYTAAILLGLQKIKKYNFSSLVQILVFTLLICVFLWGLHRGVMAVILSSLAAYLINNLVLFLLTLKETGGISSRINFSYLRDSFSYGFKTYLGNIFGTIQSRLGTLLINIFLNPMAVGFYSIARGLAEHLWLISQSAGAILFPRVSSQNNREERKKFTPLICRNVLFVSAVAAIILFFAGSWLIVLLFSDKFLNSIEPFRILLIGVTAISGSIVLGNDLYGRGKPMLNTYTAALAAGLNVLLNLLLIPRFGIGGAAWAITTTYTITFLVTLAIYSKVSGNTINEILFIKKSDFKIYKQLISLLLKKFKNKMTFSRI